MAYCSDAPGGNEEIAKHRTEGQPAETTDPSPARASISKRTEGKNHFYLLASIAIVVATLYFAQSVLIPLALGMLFAFLLTPLVTRAERLGLNRVSATLIVVLIGLAFVASLGWTMERQFAEVASHLPEYRQSIQDKLQGFMRSGRFVESVRDEIQRTVKDISKTGAATMQPAAPVPPLATSDSPWPVRVVSEPASPVTLAIEYMGAIVGRLVTVGIVIVFVIFILLRREDLRERMIQLVGDGHLSTTTEVMDEAATRVSRFLMTQSVINLSFGALVALGIWSIDRAAGGNHTGFGTALLAGILCAALRFVPYIGVWIGAALPLTVAFAVFPGNGVFITTLAMFVGLEFLTGQFIEPRLIGASTGLSPIAVLTAALFWIWLWGPIGLLLSTPLTVLLVLMGKHVPGLEFLDVLLADKPSLDPPMRVYQRLIAGDDVNALEIAEEYLKEMPLEKVYDQILLPAVAAAERDWRHGRLNDQQQEFAQLAMREIVEVLAGQATKTSAADAKAKTSEDTPDASPATNLPRGSDLHVLCLPAQDESDEIIGLMLRHLLERRGYRATVISAASLASEMVDLIDGRGADAVVISALPPRAATHARYLEKRLLSRHPDLKIVVGLWMDFHAGQDGRARARSAEPVTRLEQALERMQQFSHSILIDAGQPDTQDARQPVELPA
jgi:predicted PurR-regulated permease PerM